MHSMIKNERPRIGELREKQLLFEVAELPLLQCTRETDSLIDFGYCKLRTLAQLEDFKEQYQQIYFSPIANIKGKKAVFLQLRKLSYRISKLKLDDRKLG